jgi:hypothetical protein
MKSDSINLSDVQVGMLRFFAGQRDTPCGDIRTVTALLTRELLTQGTKTGRCRITELGQQVADQLGQAGNPAHPPINPPEQQRPLPSGLQRPHRS